MNPPPNVEAPHEAGPESVGLGAESVGLGGSDSDNGDNLTVPRLLRHCCGCGCHFPRRPGQFGDLLCQDCQRPPETWQERG